MAKGQIAVVLLLHLAILSPVLPSYALENAPRILLSFLEFWQLDRQNRQLEDLDDNVQLLKEYDFIVVGAGTAGCVMAARLSENPKWKVLLLEAGGPENFILDIPALVHTLQQNPVLNWEYKAQPSDKFCLGMKNRRCSFPRGRVMGGSSVLNYMMYTRCNRRDYDNWAAMGNVGWSYKEVLPYFKKLEGSLVPDAEPEYVGRKGPVKISYSKIREVTAEAFVKASLEDGVPYRDYNGRSQIGVSYLQSTIDERIRWSSNRAYLYPIKGKRPNLHIRKNAFVTKILIDPQTKTAYGVLFEHNGQTFQIRARKEVISSAGSINTAQLLMLSGIGPGKHLREVGIKPMADLAVGFNLQDHFAPGLTVLVNTSTLKYDDFYQPIELAKFPLKTSKLSVPGGVGALSFYDLDNPSNSADAWPDMELYVISGGLQTNPDTPKGLGIRDDIYHHLYQDIFRENLNPIMLFPMLLRPRSRGRILLRNKNPKKYPLIYPNYLHDPYDLDISVRGLQKSIQLLEKPAFRALNATVLQRKIPACAKYGDVTSRRYLECYVRHFTFTIYHQSGTAKMGPKTDRNAVVDPRLRVHGIKNLRVADASIMPRLVAGHPNGPIFMIAEKASDMIKQDYGYI